MKSIAILCALGAMSVAVATARAAEPDAGAVGKTLGVCQNAGLLKKGAFVDFQVRASGDGVSGERQFTWEAGKPKSFAGAKAVEVTQKIISGSRVETAYEYFNVKKGELLRYGAKSNGVTLSYDPPEKFPGSLKSGDQLKQTSEVTLKAPGEGSQTGVSKRTLKFDGFEKLKTPFGDVKTCKITEKSTVTAKGVSGPISTRTEIEWYAAEGPYQGFRLRLKNFGREFGSNFNATFDVIKFNAFDVK